MEGLPKVVENVRQPVDITISSYLLDHCVEGNAVLPAVEALEILVESVLLVNPDMDVSCLLDGRFDKFLPLCPQDESIAAISDIAFYENGDITAKLLTKTTSKKASITRIKEHATIRFSQDKQNTQQLPLDWAASLEGIVYPVSAKRIYEDLVPFGPAYHNIRNTLYLSLDGAMAHIEDPFHGLQEGSGKHLGSPFPLDAAFHAACVWGQRFAGFVAFPVGFEKRVIFEPNEQEHRYIARVIPVGRSSNTLVFDTWIYNSKGCLLEAALGIAMRDVSAGRMTPPPWILSKESANQRRKGIIGRHQFCLVENAVLAPFAAEALSEMEIERFKDMGPKRKKHFLGARLACKRLVRRVSGNDMDTPATKINTVHADKIRPCCPFTDGKVGLFCTVSHDNRFAVAAVSKRKIGVDIEKVSPRVLECQDLFMKGEEKALLKSSALDMIASTLRVWSIKEAACKALNIDLAEAWKRVEVTEIGRDKSYVIINNVGPLQVFHDIIEKHVMTIIEIP